MSADEQYRALLNRLAALEVAVYKHAAESGARSGRLWGALFGALVALTVCGLLSHCYICDHSPALIKLK